MGPRADFTCLAPACDSLEGAAVYELPVTATRCPVCGSKRIRRLFNAVNVGSAGARAHAQMLESSSLPAQADAARAAHAEAEKTPVLKIGAGTALGAVRGDRDAVIQSHGTMQIIRALGKPRPTYG
jgi:hypothetical protein